MFWLFANIGIVLGEPVFFDSAAENWFHQIDKINEQVVFGGRIVEQEEAFVWVYSWDQEWSVVAQGPSDMQSMATNSSQIAVCGFSRTDMGPKSWVWILDEQGNSIKDIILVEEGVSDCTSIVSYQDGWLASVVLREPDRKRSTLIQISADGETEQLIEPIDDVEIMGVASRMVGNHSEIALTGFSLSPEQTSGWIGVLDQNLQLRWSQELGEGEFNKFKNLGLDQEGKLLSCGYTTPQAPENWDIWLLHWDWEGNILFETIWGGDKMDGCKGLRPSPNGFVFIGDSESYGADDWDILRGEVDAFGEVLDWEIYGEIGDDYGYDFLWDENRLIWIGALERDEDGKRVAWVEEEILPEQEIGDTGDTGIESVEPKKCGCRDSKSGLLMLPLFGFFWGRRRN